MATSVGRVREDGVLENGIKYVLVSHNTKMGAAKGAVLGEGRAQRAGRSLIFSEGELRAEDGTLLAKATGTFKLLYPSNKD